MLVCIHRKQDVQSVIIDSLLILIIIIVSKYSNKLINVCIPNKIERFKILWFILLLFILNVKVHVYEQITEQIKSVKFLGARQKSRSRLVFTFFPTYTYKYASTQKRWEFFCHFYETVGKVKHYFLEFLSNLYFSHIITTRKFPFGAYTRINYTN